MRQVVAAMRRMALPRRLFQCFVLLSAVSAMSCPEGEDVLSAYGYQSLVPPSNLMTVGTIVALEDDTGKEGEQTSKFKIVCGPRAGWGAYFSPVSNRTMTQSMRHKAKSSWQISGQMLEHVKAGASGSKVKSITATLRDARILSLSDADVLEALPHRSEPCKLAIRARLEQGYELTVISQALLADMTYEIEWDEKKEVNKRIRLQEMQHVAASLGSGATRVGMKSIESKGLALGIRTDAFLLALSVPELNKCQKSVMNQAQRERQPSSGPMYVDPSPDAPLVLPANGSYIVPEFVDE